MLAIDALIDLVLRIFTADTIASFSLVQGFANHKLWCLVLTACWNFEKVRPYQFSKKYSLLKILC